MASMTFNIRIEREGLIMKLYTAESNRLITTVDLSKELKLSDEQASLLLQKLEEKSECQQ